MSQTKKIVNIIQLASNLSLVFAKYLVRYIRPSFILIGVCLNATQTAFSFRIHVSHDNSIMTHDDITVHAFDVIMIISS